MAGALGLSGGKQRSKSGFAAGPMQSIDRKLFPIGAERNMNSQLMSQMSEALRTGGIGAQIPIIQQSVSGAKQALSGSMQSQTDQLSRSGLAGTPFGQRQLAQTQMLGNQGIAQLPTQQAQQFINMAPQFSMSALQAILGTLQKQTARSGPYST